MTRIKRLAEQKNVTEFDLIAAAIEQTGSIQAAAASLGVPYASLHYWILRNGYKVEKRALLIRE